MPKFIWVTEVEKYINCSCCWKICL